MKNLPAPRRSSAASELDEIDRCSRIPTAACSRSSGRAGWARRDSRSRPPRAGSSATCTACTSFPSSRWRRRSSWRRRLPSRSSSRRTAPTRFSVQEQLLDYLSERSTLLVLDNFEHLVDGADLLGEIIERAPQVELLTTSRERLNVQSEWVLDVQGLELAENGNGSAGALRLFVERATQVEQGFSLDDDERAEAHRICRLVEGLPLGIELAASWVSVLSCAEIADEIERNIDFLATSMRDVPERHRSLRAAFDQSWRLLSGEQQDVLARLSVLRGDYGREAAAAVSGADVRLLSELVSKSLVRRTDFGRFELHELLRQYAAERLAALPGEERDARERHARHYAAMLMERQAALMGWDLAVARDELRGELDNLRAAAEWTLAEDDEHVALPVLGAFYTFLWMHSWFDGAETLERLARTAGFDPDEPGSASAVALTAAMYRVAIGARLGYDPAAEELAARCCPSCGRGTCSESSQAACARWASWRCIGTSTRRRWRSAKGADRESDRRRAHGERRSDGSRFRQTPAG